MVRREPRTIFITRATLGIGRHAAAHLARKGHRVIASGRNVAVLERLEDKAGVRTVRLDVTDRDANLTGADEVLRLTDGEGIDVLVNNAGYGMAGPLMEIPVLPPGPLRVPASSRLFLVALALLPTRFQDPVARRLFGLTPRALEIFEPQALHSPESSAQGE